MNLVIVESPAKSKTIEKYLGKDYKVVASMGHIRDLPKSKLGVDVENHFQETYEVSPTKQKTITAIKKLVKEADKVFLATDPDREGEAISWHIMQVLEEPASSKVKSQRSKTKVILGSEATPESEVNADSGRGITLVTGSAKAEGRMTDAPFFKRVVFNEITKEAVIKAFENPRDIDFNLVDAQRARRVLDRLVGYKLSPLLWKKIRYGLSAGRVQSVAVRFVAEREKEINNFSSEKYFEVIAHLDPALSAKLTKINNDSVYLQQKYKLFSGDYTVSKTTIDTVSKLDSISANLNLSTFVVDSVERKDFLSYPKPPFTTSSLQQEASWKLGFSPKRTMSAAQKLYEQGFITYMRTDSFNLNADAVDNIRKLVLKDFGKEYLPQSPIFYKTKVKVAQEAHEAIRPVDATRSLGDKIGADEEKLYRIIWQRAISCQMVPAVYDQVKVKIHAIHEDQNYLLESKESVLKFAGWQTVYSEGSKAGLPQIGVTPNCEIAVGATLKLQSLETLEKQTTPPPSYNEASLIKDLEKFGIGRPSTYAPIMSTIQDRGYVQKIDNKLKPTDVGLVVNNLLCDHFKEIVDLNFTAGIEEELDEIANGEKKWDKVIGDFYTPFEKLLSEKHDNLDKANYTVLEKLEEKCPDCKSDLIIKLGKYGRFVSCSNYPTCKYLRPIVESLGIKCPKCKEGDVVARRTKKRGKTFYGCNKYPQCDFAVWKLEELTNSSSEKG